MLRSALEEADEAGNSSIFATLASSLMKIEVAKGNYWKTAINPYGSEFSYVSVREVSFLVLFLVSSLADAVAASITLRMICTPFFKKNPTGHDGDGRSSSVAAVLWL